MSVEFPLNKYGERYAGIETEQLVSPELGEENELETGEYILIVPEGQRAIVRYEKDS